MSELKDSWQPCEPGQLRDFAGQVQSAKRRNELMRGLAAATLACAALTLVMTTAAMTFKQTTAPTIPVNQTRLSCSKVIKVYDDYAAGELDDELTVRVSTHLDNCPHCRQRLGVDQRDGSTRVVPPPADHQAFSTAWPPLAHR